MTPPITIRIARLVVEALSRADAEATAAAFRTELARLAAEGRLPSAPPHAPALCTLNAYTPAGRGREASALLAPRAPFHSIEQGRVVR
jgi:hypothetical protein